MQVKCWLGIKQVGRTDVHQLTFPAPCRSPPGAARPCFERLRGWPLLRAHGRRIDPVPRSAQRGGKAEARDRIVRTLNRGLETYELQIGDEFEIFDSAITTCCATCRGPIWRFPCRDQTRRGGARSPRVTSGQYSSSRASNPGCRSSAKGTAPSCAVRGRFREPATLAPV